MKMVNFPTTLKEIKDYAFQGCTGMNGELNILDGVTTIGRYAFKGCTGINGTLRFPSTLTSINYSTSDTLGIEKLVIQDNMENISERSFSGNNNLTEITIPISLNATGGSTSFYGCTNITKINFTKGTGTGHDYSNSTNGSYYQNTPWYISRGHEIEVKFEEGITTIGTYMFYRM